MTEFWRKWLTAWCGGVLLFGVVLAGGAFEATSGPVRAVLALLDGPGDPSFDPHLRFSLALMGAVSIGWSITLYAAIRAACEIGGAAARRLWLGITVSAIAWYAIDSTLSVATGFGMNAVPNTLLLAGYLLPVVRSGVLRG